MLVLFGDTISIFLQSEVVCIYCSCYPRAVVTTVVVVAAGIELGSDDAYKQYILRTEVHGSVLRSVVRTSPASQYQNCMPTL